MSGVGAPPVVVAGGGTVTGVEVASAAGSGVVGSGAVGSSVVGSGVVGSGVVGPGVVGSGVVGAGASGVGVVGSGVGAGAVGVVSGAVGGGLGVTAGVGGAVGGVAGDGLPVGAAGCWAVGRVEAGRVEVGRGVEVTSSAGVCATVAPSQGLYGSVVRGRAATPSSVRSLPELTAVPVSALANGASVLAGTRPRTATEEGKTGLSPTDVEGERRGPASASAFRSGAAEAAPASTVESTAPTVRTAATNTETPSAVFRGSRRAGRLTADPLPSRRRPAPDLSHVSIGTLLRALERRHPNGLAGGAVPSGTVPGRLPALVAWPTFAPAYAAASRKDSPSALPAARPAHPTASRRQPTRRPVPSRRSPSR